MPLHVEERIPSLQAGAFLFADVTAPAILCPLNLAYWGSKADHIVALASLIVSDWRIFLLPRDRGSEALHTGF